MLMVGAEMAATVGSGVGASVGCTGTVKVTLVQTVSAPSGRAPTEKV